MTAADDERFLVRTITSITRWNASVEANIDRLIESSSSPVESVIVNKVGAPVSDYIAAADASRRLRTVDGVWEDIYGTWAQFEAPPNTWTICLHDDDSWRGPIVPRNLLLNPRSSLLVLPTMLDPYGVPTTDDAYARALADVGTIDSPVDGMSKMARHCFPAFYAYTPAVAWNCWREFTLTRPVYLPHLDWQLNFAAAALSTRVQRADLVYLRDQSNWSSVDAARASLSRQYHELGLSPETSQLDSLVSTLHTLALARYLPVSAEERRSVVEFLLAQLRTRKRRIARSLKLLPNSLGAAMGNKAYRAQLVAVDLSLHQSLIPSYFGKIDLNTISDVRRNLIPACRSCDSSVPWALIMDQLDLDLAQLP